MFYSVLLVYVCVCMCVLLFLWSYIIIDSFLIGTYEIAVSIFVSIETAQKSFLKGSSFYFSNVLFLY